MSLIVEVFCVKTFRIRKFSADPGLSYEDLVSAITKGDANKKLCITYVDPENDFVSIVNSEDLKMAVDLVDDKRLLRLFVNSCDCAVGSGTPKKVHHLAEKTIAIRQKIAYSYLKAKYPRGNSARSAADKSTAKESAPVTSRGSAPVTRTVSRGESYPGVKKISVTVNSGNIYKTHDVVGKDDPYVTVEIGGVKRQTQTLNGTQNPVWNETLVFANVSAAAADTAVVELYDSDSFTRNDLVGSTSVSLLPDTAAATGKKNVSVTLYDPAGTEQAKVELSITYDAPAAAPAPAPVSERATTPDSEAEPSSPTSKSETKSVPATPKSETEASPGTPKSETKSSPGTPKSETEPSPGTPKSETKSSPGTPKSETKSAPATPKSETEPSPGTPKSETEPSPGTPKSETKSAPATPKSETEPSPGTPKSETEPSPGTPKSETESAPATPKSETEPSPATPATPATPDSPSASASASDSAPAAPAEGDGDDGEADIIKAMAKLAGDASGENGEERKEAVEEEHAAVKERNLEGGEGGEDAPTYTKSTVSITVVSATVAKSHDVLGKGDPFVIIKLAGQENQTQVIKDTQNPVWNQKFTFEDVPYDTASATLEMYDKDSISHDDLIGTAEYSLDAAKGGNKVTQDVVLNDENGDPAATVIVEVEVVGTTE